MMPLRGRRGGKAKAQRAASAEVAADQLTVHEHNAEYYAQVRRWINTIEAHPIFRNISQELAVGDGSSQPAFNMNDLAVAIETTGSYTCGFNLFWCDALWTPTPGIPIRTGLVNRLMDYHFGHPTSLSRPVVIALMPGEAPLERKGAVDSKPTAEPRLWLSSVTPV